MRATTVSAAALAILGVAAARGVVPTGPFPAGAGWLLVVPLAALLFAHVRGARQRRLRRYGLGW